MPTFKVTCRFTLEIVAENKFKAMEEAEKTGSKKLNVDVGLPQLVPGAYIVSAKWEECQSVDELDDQGNIIRMG